MRSRAGKKEQGETLESLEDWTLGVNHMLMGTGLFLEGKVGHIVWEEVTKVERRAEHWLEDDLGSPTRRGKKNFFPLLIHERDVSKRDVKVFFPL